MGMLSPYDSKSESYNFMSYLKNYAQFFIGNNQWNIQAPMKTFLQHSEKKSIIVTGLSVNILCTGDKSPMQRGFFTNSVGDLLPALGFLGRLYNFLNFVIIFLQCKSWWYVEVATYFTDLRMIEYYQKTCNWNRSLRKLKTT